MISGAAIWVKLAVPKMVEEQLPQKIKENCPSCTFEMKKAKISVLSFSVTLEEPKFRSGDPKTTGVEAEALRIVAKISPFKLLSNQVHFRHIQVDRPKVVVTEGDLPTARSKGGDSDETPEWTAIIEKTDLSDGNFVYVRVHNGKPAPITVKEINGEVGRVGTTPELKNEIVKAECTGQLEESGKFTLTVSSIVFSKNPHVDMDLKMKGQNLADLNPYFQTNEGITLMGSIYVGQAVATIRDTKLNAWVKAKYLGLDFQFNQTKERSPVSTFISNLVKSFKMESSSIGKDIKDQVRGVEMQHLPQETSL